MSVPRPWLVVFDLDGTLIDSSLDLCHSVNAALGHVGAAALPHPLISSYIGDGAAALVRRALQQASPRPQLDEGTFERCFAFFLDFYRLHKLDNTRLYEGVLSSLEAIRAAAPALPMAVLTNKPVRASREICEGLGIARFFFAVYGGNSFATKKPDPAGLLALLSEAKEHLRLPDDRRASLGPEGVVMVGDSSTDVLTAQRAGTRSLGCRYGLAPDSLQAVPPDMQCDTAWQWPELLGLAETDASQTT